jgi:CRP-like cAMP-binding protein
MREHAPITIQRMLTLRQVPGFGDADLSELATIAENLVERTFVAGSTVATPATRVPAIHLVLEGRLESAGRIESAGRLESAGRHAWGPRQLFGALEVIAGRPLAERVVATTDTRTLQLATTDFSEILEDNYSVMSSTRRMLARRLATLDTTLAHRPRVLVDDVASSLGLVDRLLVLRGQLPFARGSIQALTTLAAATEELYFPVRTPIARAGDEADGLLVVLDGVAKMRRTHGPDILAAGAAIGALETLGELPYTSDIDTISALRVLRLPSGALFDVMEDHTDFAIALVGKLASELLDLAQLPAEVN